jgi:hypothetical protein
MDSKNTYKAARPMVWVKDSRGDTWICPVGSIKNPGGASEKELRGSCMNESENPQNN